MNCEPGRHTISMHAADDPRRPAACSCGAIQIALASSPYDTYQRIVVRLDPADEAREREAVNLEELVEIA